MANTNNKRWFVTAKSESGDDYGVIAEYDHEPSTEELMALTHHDNFGADGWDPLTLDGPGFHGSYLHLLVSRETRGEFSGEYVPQEPVRQKEAEAVEPPKKPTARLPSHLKRQLQRLDNLLNDVDEILVDLTEYPDLEDVDPELQEAFEDFADSVKWEKYHEFLRMLKERTNFKK